MQEIESNHSFCNFRKELIFSFNSIELFLKTFFNYWILTEVWRSCCFLSDFSIFSVSSWVSTIMLRFLQLHWTSLKVLNFPWFWHYQLKCRKYDHFSNKTATSFLKKRLYAIFSKVKLIQKNFMFKNTKKKNTA